MPPAVVDARPPSPLTSPCSEQKIEALAEKAKIARHKVAKVATPEPIFTEVLSSIQDEVMAYAKSTALDAPEEPAGVNTGEAIAAKGVPKVGMQPEDYQTWLGKKPKTYIAPDGTEFETEAKYKRYMFANYYSFCDRKGETLLRRPGSIRGNSFDLSNLEGCEVQLLDNIGQVLIDGLTDCKVYVGACVSDVFVRNCKNCVFTVACKQLRTRDCSYCKVYLYSMTRPALETSHNMEFGRFNGAYPRQASHFRKAGLCPENNQWDQVHDFSNSDKEMPRPHWSKIADNKWEEWSIGFEDSKMKPENPVPQRSNALWFMEGPRGGSNPIMGIGQKKAGAKGGLGKKKAGVSIFGKFK